MTPSDLVDGRNPQIRDTVETSSEELSHWSEYGWFSQHTGTRPIGLLHPLGIGIYDAIGNVFEWCYDFFEPYSQKIEERTVRYRNEKITILQVGQSFDSRTGTKRVLRGGSWSLSQTFSHPMIRFAQDPLRRSSSIGFRIVKNQ